MSPTPDPLDLLLARLRAAGLDVADAVPATGGMATVAGLVTLADGAAVFAKTLPGTPVDGVFAGEADGLRALAEAGLATPDVVLADTDVLVLSRAQPAPEDRGFWELLGRTLAAVHAATRAPRFGWPGPTWLGRLPQDNTWTDDGFDFFAERRLLRWLPEPRVQAKLDAPDRAALERLCARLPELLPPAPACLVHGDLWAANVMSDGAGRPVVIDPAISYAWAEIDLAHLWSTPRPPAADACLSAYAEAAGLDAGWQQRMPLIQMRQHLALMAQHDDDWGSTRAARELLAPFRPRPVP